MADYKEKISTHLVGYHFSPQIVSLNRSISRVHNCGRKKDSVHKNDQTNEGTFRGDKKLLASDCFYPVDPSD